jgi:acetyl esterase/lipase
VDLFKENSGEGERFENLKRIIIAGHSAGGY